MNVIGYTQRIRKIAVEAADTPEEASKIQKDAREREFLQDAVKGVNI